MKIRNKITGVEGNAYPGYGDTWYSHSGFTKKGYSTKNALLEEWFNMDERAYYDRVLNEKVRASRDELELNKQSPVLSGNAEERNAIPLADGLLYYFPNALAAVAAVSVAGNKQHNLGPLHWDRSKSTNHADKILRHQIDAGTMDTDGTRHSAKVAWRALAQLEDELIEAGATPGKNVRNSPNKEESIEQSNSNTGNTVEQRRVSNNEEDLRANPFYTGGWHSALD